MNGREAFLALELHAERAVLGCLLAARGSERLERNTGCLLRPAGFFRKFPRPRPDRFLELRGRNDLVHQPPFNGASALHALLGRAENIGAVAAYFALVGDPREAAGTRQNSQERQLRQGYGG